jgi:RNA polymerase sigma-70 factor (family 1)
LLADKFKKELSSNDERDKKDYPEKELIGKVRKSCQNSFKIIFFKYYESLYRFIWMRVHDSELARDLLQDVFIKIWDNRQILDANKSFKAYLYRITNNLIIDLVRKNKVKEKVFRMNQELNYYESEEEYYNSIDIQNALNQLPQKLRMVVILSRYEGLNYMEIAEICDVSFQTVGFRLNKALQLMNKYLSE